MQCNTEEHLNTTLTLTYLFLSTRDVMSTLVGETDVRFSCTSFRNLPCCRSLEASNKLWALTLIFPKISPASLSEKVTVMFQQWIRSLRWHLPKLYGSVVFFSLRMISNNLIRQLCERLWLELTTYEIKDDNAFVLFPPRFISTAFFLWCGFCSEAMTKISFKSRHV